jgi:hypothetical protein
VKIGEVLTLAQAAQLLEIPAAQLVRDVGPVITPGLVTHVAGTIRLIAYGFSTKAKGWAYECEHRHFIRLDGCEMIGSHYFRGIPIPSLREVILGVKCRITPTDIRRIVNSWGPLLRKDGPRILKARPHKTPYKITTEAEKS